MAIVPTLIGGFVGREKQINLIDDRIGIIQYGGSVFQAVINFCGVVGIGKTVLLRELEKLIRDKGLPCALIDFKGKEVWSHFSPQSQVTLLEDMVNNFSADGDTSTFKEEVTHFRRQLDTGRLTESQLQMIVQAFLDYVESLIKDQNAPAILLLDTLDQVNAELMDWLEDAVISPLIRTDQVLVIVASRAPHRWKRFEVRRRSYQERLEPFDEETTEEQLPPKYGPLASNIRYLTGGHPFGNVQVVQSVGQIEQGEGRSLQQADFEEYEKQLVQELVGRLIEPVVMRDVPDEIRCAYRVVALARHFDVNVLRRLLAQFVKEPFADKSAAYFLSVVGTMVKSTLVEWSSARRGYVLDDTIRWMLALNMKLSAQERYEKINQELSELYDSWIERVPENRSGFIIERLYHEACLQSVQGADAETIADRLCSLLAGYLEKYYPLENEKMPHGVIALKEELKKDEGLAKFLPHGQVTCLTKIVERTINSNYQELDTASSGPGGQA